MPRLLIGNDFPEQMSTTTPSRQEGLVWWSLRILWYIRDDDVLLLPEHPDQDCLDYVAALTRTEVASLRIVVPEGGFEALTSASITDTALLDWLDTALDGREWTRILPLCPTKPVADLARALGATSALPGIGFLEQNGGGLANGKAAFRALASGTGVPVPDGVVCTTSAETTDAVTGMSVDGPVLLKKDFDQGCHGNTLVSRVPGTSEAGASSAHVLSDGAAIAAFVDDWWAWLSDHGRHPIVIERYHPGSRAVFAEFDIAEEGVTLAADGELVATPMPDGQVIPVPDLSLEELRILHEGGHELAKTLHAIGYRGPLSADAILSDDGEVLFTENNARLTGSTHIHDVVGRRVVGDTSDRILVERQGWTSPSFGAAARTLREANLAYDPTTRSGVVLTMPHNPRSGMVSYTIITPDRAAADRTERELQELSPTARQHVRN